MKDEQDNCEKKGKEEIKEESKNNVIFYRSRKKTGNNKKIEYIQACTKVGFSIDKGTWSFICIDGKKDVVSIHGDENNIDKNRLDLIPVLEVLKWMYDPSKKKILTLYTESSYVVNCVQEWMEKWKRNDFKIDSNTENLMDRPNADILRLINKYKISVITNVKLVTTENEMLSKINTMYGEIKE